MDAKFFCETCHNKVPFNAAECPHCGRLFSSTKCPMCQFESNSSAFLNGCPKCGYMNPAASSLKIVQENDLPQDKKTSKRRFIFSEDKKEKKHVPAWVYLFSSILLAVLLFIFIIIIIFQVV